MLLVWGSRKRDALSKFALAGLAPDFQLLKFALSKKSTILQLYRLESTEEMSSNLRNKNMEILPLYTTSEEYVFRWWRGVQGRQIQICIVGLVLVFSIIDNMRWANKSTLLDFWIATCVKNFLKLFFWHRLGSIERITSTLRNKKRVGKPHLHDFQGICISKGEGSTGKSNPNLHKGEVAPEFSIIENVRWVRKSTIFHF